MKPSLSVLMVCTSITSVVSAIDAKAQQPTNCTYWGETAELVGINYDTVISMGSSPEQAMAETKELFDYDNHIKKGGMGGAYYGAVFEAIESGARDDALHQVGAKVCMSYPARQFDPDGFGKYD